MQYSHHHNGLVNQFRADITIHNKKHDESPLPPQPERNPHTSPPHLQTIPLSRLLAMVQAEESRLKDTGLYLEEQRDQHCAMHALNMLHGKAMTTPQLFFSTAQYISHFNTGGEIHSQPDGRWSIEVLTRILVSECGCDVTQYMGTLSESQICDIQSKLDPNTIIGIIMSDSAHFWSILPIIVHRYFVWVVLNSYPPVHKAPPEFFVDIIPYLNYFNSSNRTLHTFLLITHPSPRKSERPLPLPHPPMKDPSTTIPPPALLRSVISESRRLNELQNKLPKNNESDQTNQDNQK